MPFLFRTVLEVSAREIRREKELKSNEVKKKIQKTILTRNMLYRIYTKLIATVWTFAVPSEEPLLKGYLQVSVI